MQADPTFSRTRHTKAEPAQICDFLSMLSRSALRSLSSTRLFSSSAARQTRVAVLGAGGGIGQPLSLLLKSDPLVSSLSLYDIKGAPGVAADVSHVDTPSEVKGYAADQLDQALEGVQVVVIPAGVPRKVSCPFPRTTIPYSCQTLTARSEYFTLLSTLNMA